MDRVEIMSTDHYLSTGEAAQILNISRSTVSRRFDAGLLEGKLNPITGERLISRKSVEDTIRKHNLPVDIPFSGLKHVLVSTADQELTGTVDDLIGSDHRIHVDNSAQGSDTLIACSKNTPDLLIIDDQLPDLRASHVVKSLRKYVDMEQIKILYCGKGTNGNNGPATMWGADASIDMDNEDERNTFKETIYRLLAIPIEVSRRKGIHEHKRRWPRFPVNLDAKLAVFPKARPNEQVAGSAKLNNISRGGAYLTNILLDNASLPGEPFSLALSVDNDPLRNWNAKCRVMRLQSNGSLSAGVQFESMSSDNRQKLTELRDN